VRIDWAETMIFEAVSPCLCCKQATGLQGSLAALAIDNNYIPNASKGFEKLTKGLILRLDSGNYSHRVLFSLL
jgi:CO dehydrogenase/acetyl-CoA synthase epsilon subunit